MLRLLSGRVHDVHTAVVVRRPAGERAEVVTTRVRFLPLDDAEIDVVRRLRRAGGQGRRLRDQGRAARFIDRIEGSWSNVVGLPLATVSARMLKEAVGWLIDPSRKATVF